MDYTYKYTKYDKKCDFLKEKMNGGKYECLPQNSFNKICIENEKGKYNKKEGCINECETQYMNYHLTKENLSQETSKFYRFIKTIIKEENIDVFVKGGNVIGLQILKMIYDKYKDNDEIFKKYFNDFLELELIKDWDFTSYSKKEITESYREKLDNLAKKNHLVPRAKTFILYQTKRPILTDGKALFEISVLDKETYSKLEIPLTTMKVKVNEYNLKYIFMFAKSFIAHKKGEEFDFDLLKRLISKISINIHPHKEGLYDNLNDIDMGCLNDKLIKFINKYSKYDKNLPQFLATHIEDPFRITYRLPEKNIPKTKKIKEYLKKVFPDKKNIEWLFDIDFIVEMIEKFTKDFGDELLSIYKLDGLDSVVAFVDGIYWSRIEIEYKKLILDYGRKLIDNMLGKLIDSMGKENIEKLDKSNKFFHLLQFLANK